VKRKEAFHRIKGLYDERSDIVHGRSLGSKSDNERINQFEGDVRQSIREFLKLHRAGRLVNPHMEKSKRAFNRKLDEFRRKLDELLFFTGETGQAN